MKDLLFFSETFAKMNRFHYNKGKSFAKKIGRRIMKKIDAHLHLVRDLASYKGNGRRNALGNGLVVWDSGFKTRLFPAGWGDDAFRADAARKVMEDYDVAKAVLLQGSLYGFQNYYSWQAATFNDYGQLYSWLEDAGIFSEAELADVYYGNAKRIYFKADHVAALRASRDPLFEGDA